MMIDINQTTCEIIDWANDRNIINGSTMKDQFVKLAEEFGELADAIAHNDSDLIEDAIGDMFVVLTIIAEQNVKLNRPEDYEEGTDEEDEVYPCISFNIISAYNTIRNRKGKMIDGVFVKEIDSNAN